MTVLRKSFYIHWSAGRSPRVHEVNPGRDPSHYTYKHKSGNVFSCISVVNVEKFPEIFTAILSKFPVSMTMETKQHEEISSARNIKLFWCNFQEILIERKF